MKKAAKRKTKNDNMVVDEGETHNNKNTSDKPEANSPTTSTGQSTIKVPVLFQLHGHQSKRTGSFDTASSSSPTSMMMAADHTQATLNNNNNDTNIMWLKPGENWLRLLPRASGEKSILDDTQDTFSMAAARYMPIPQILSARDYGYDMSQLLIQSSVKAEGNDSNNHNNDCVFLVVDVDDLHVRTSSNDNASSLPKFQLAIKDMRFPVHPQSNKNKTEQNASMPQQDTTPFELCLARRTSPLDDEQQQQVDFNKHKEGSKENEQEEDHFWAGYTALERLPRRQLRVLQLGDRLCTRIVTSSSRSSSPTGGEGYDFGGERKDDQEEEGDFSGVGLVLEYRLEDQHLSCKEEEEEEELEQEEEEEDGGRYHPSQPTSSPLMSQEEQLQTQFSTTKDDDENHLDNDEKDDNDDDSATTVGEGEEGIMTQMETDDGPPLGQPSDESPVAGNGNKNDNDDDSNNDDKDDDIILQYGDDNDGTGKKDEAVVVDNLLITQPEESEKHDDKGKHTKSNNNDNGNDSDDSDTTIGEENDDDNDKPTAEVAVMQDEDKTADNGGDDDEHKLDGTKGDGKETASNVGEPSKDGTEKGKVENEDDDDDDATTIGSAQGEPEEESAKETKDDDKAVLAPSAAVIDSQATETEEEEQAKQPPSSDEKETTERGNDKKIESDKTAQVVEKNPNKNSTKDSQHTDGDTDDDTTVNVGDDATKDLAAVAEADDTKVEVGAKKSSKKEPPKKNAKKETPKRKAGKKGKGKNDENESLENRLPESVKNGLEGATPVFRLEDVDDEDITEPGESPPRRSLSTRQGSQKEADVPVSVSVGGAEDGPFLTVDTDITSPAREYQTYGSRRRSSPRVSGDSQKKDLIITKEIEDDQKPEAPTKEEETEDEKESTDKGKSDNVDDTSKGESQPIAGNDSESKDGVDGQKTTAPRSRQTRAKRNISELAEDEGKEAKKISSEHKSATAVDDKGILDKIKEDDEKLALPKAKAKKSRVSRVKTKRSIEVDEGEEAEFDKIVPMSNSRSSPTGSESSDPAAVGRQKRRKRGELSPKAPQGTPPVDGGGEPAEVDQETSKPPDPSVPPSPGKDGGEGQGEGADETPQAEDETAVDNVGAAHSTAKDSEETSDKDDKKTRPKRGQKVSAKTESNSSTENVEATPSRSTTRKRKPVSSTPVVTEGKRTRVSARATRTPRKAEAEETKASDTEGADDAGKRTRVSDRATRTPRNSKPEETKAKGTEESDTAVRIMTTGVRPLSKKELSTAKRLCWEVLDDIQDSPHATHIIAGEKGVSMRRTPKLMVGICCTYNIVSLDWLLQSLKAKKALPVENFLLVSDTIAERKYDFSLQASLERAAELRKNDKKLFQGWYIHACKGVAGHKAPPEKELKLIVEQIGAVWTPALNKKTLGGLDLSHLLIITSDSDPEQKKQVSVKAVADAIKGGARQQTTSWLFGCIIRVEIPP